MGKESKKQTSIIIRQQYQRLKKVYEFDKQEGDEGINTLYKKWSFPLMISSVNVPKSSGNCNFGHIYWKNP